jgi:heme-degrading monooxygenase HmoA
MHARTGTLQVSPERIDDVVSMLRDQQIPQYRDQQGYKGFTVLADRDSGTVVGISFWESEDDLQASEDLAEQARSQAADTGEASGEPRVDRYEVLLDDMV